MKLKIFTGKKFQVLYLGVWILMFRYGKVWLLKINNLSGI